MLNKFRILNGELKRLFSLNQNSPKDRANKNNNFAFTINRNSAISRDPENFKKQIQSNSNGLE